MENIIHKKVGEIAHVTKLAGFEFTEYFDYVADGEIIALRALNVKNGKLILDDIKRIKKEVSDKLRRSKLVIGDLLFTYVGTLGEVAIIKEDNRFHLAPNVALIRTEESEAKYLMYLLLSEMGKREILKYQTTTSQPALSMENIRKISLPILPLPEQKKIALILGSVDEHIGKVEEQIVDLKELKKGLMQKLLTEGIGHTEFKDSPLGRIPIDWEVKYIGDICSIKTGNRDTQDKEDNGKYPFYVRSNTVERINSYSFEGEAVLTSGDGVGVGKIFHYLNEKFDYHQRVYNMHNFDEKVLAKYFYYYFSEHFYKRVSRLSAKNSVDSVRMEMISKMLFPIPPLEEQKKISKILSSVDNRIEEYENKYKDLQELKKGLMQQLLTGKKRVKV